MEKFKSFLFIIFVIFIGIFIGFNIYKYKNIKIKDAFMNETKIYLLQYGVYKDENNMKESGKILNDYFYYYDKDGYHIIIGITLDKSLTDKIKSSFDIQDIYLKEVLVNNNEFIEYLKQYDQLIKSLKEKESIITAEIQILNKYEELVLENN